MSRVHTPSHFSFPLSVEAVSRGALFNAGDRRGIALVFNPR